MDQAVTASAQVNRPLRVSPFDPLVRPIPFHHDGSTTAWCKVLCPCGSGLASEGCHLHRPTGKWRLPTYQPPLIGPITGFAHRRCYAANTNDCDNKLTLEHPLSKSILKDIGGGSTVTASNTYWQKDSPAPTDLPVATMGSRMLCNRHNTALSKLDDTALEVYRTLERFQLAQLRHPDPHGNEFNLVSGERFERWILKVLWGMTAGAKTTPGSMKDQRERKVFMRYLFRDGLLPRGWGLHLCSLTGSFTRQYKTAMETKIDVRDDTFLAGDVTLGAFTFTFTAGVVEAGNGAIAHHRPDGIRMFSEFDNTCKLLAFAWDHRRHMAANYVSINFRGNR